MTKAQDRALGQGVGGEQSQIGWETCCTVLSRSVCPTLRDHMDCSPAGSSVHGVL